MGNHRLYSHDTTVNYPKPKIAAAQLLAALPIMLKGLELAKTAARYADDIQAEDIVILDLRGLSQLTDFFVVCSANSQPHLKAVSQEISHHLAENDKTVANRSDGKSESQWLILDFFDVIIHVFHRDKRGVYAIEDLWADAPRIEFQSNHSATAATTGGEVDN